MRTPNIADKVVVITGASSGIGESTARLLAGSGAKVVLGDRRADRIDALVRDITAKGGAALGFQADVTKRSEVEALVQGAIRRSCKSKNRGTSSTCLLSGASRSGP